MSCYRLKQTDYDGKFEYFEIVAVSSTNIEDVTIFPNPVQDNLKLSFNSIRINSEVFLKIYDVQGILVVGHIFMTKDGLNEASIDMEESAQGMYFVALKNEGEVKRIKFIKE